MIDRNQANQTAMLRTLFGHNQSHPEVLAGVTFLQTLTTMLNSSLGNLDLIAADAGVTDGITENKATARREAISFAVPIAAALKAHANFGGDAELRVKVDFSRSDLEGLREENYLPAIEGIATQAQTLAATIAGRGISAAHIASLVMWNGKFRALLSAPQQKQTDITEDTAKYDKLLGETMTLVREQMDPTAEAASLTFPDFFVGYRAARVVIDRPGGLGGPTPPTPPTP